MATKKVSDIVGKLKNEVFLRMESQPSKKKLSTKIFEQQWNFSIESIHEDSKALNDYWNIKLPGTPYGKARLIKKLIFKVKAHIANLVDFKLKPVLEQQRIFNAALTRILNETIAFIADVVDKINHIERAVSENESRLNLEIEKIRIQFENNVEQTSLDREFIHNSINVVEKEISDIREDLGIAISNVEMIRKRLESQQTLNQVDYAIFEDTFRGTEEFIFSRMQYYLPIIRDSEQVLDIGCGRGEFLELCKKYGISALGIDLNDSMLDRVRKKGLDIVKADALEYIESTTQGSFDCVVIIQVVEHLEFSYIMNLLSAIFRKMKEGGQILIETPNPKSLFIFSNSYYIDPTHKNPIHPNTMRYMLEISGFEFKEVHELNKPEDILLGSNLYEDQNLNHDVQLLNRLIFSGQDYLMVGIKGVLE